MSKIIRFIFILGIIIMSANVSASAQKHKRMSNNPDERRIGVLPKFSARPHKTSAIVSYDEASTMLTVQFSPNSHGGTIDVYRDGEKVAGITANSGTTFSCVLREYGTGNYNVIVSNENTVVESKNFAVR